MLYDDGDEEDDDVAEGGEGSNHVEEANSMERPEELAGRLGLRI